MSDTRVHHLFISHKSILLSLFSRFSRPRAGCGGLVLLRCTLLAARSIAAVAVSAGLIGVRSGVVVDAVALLLRVARHLYVV